MKTIVAALAAFAVAGGIAYAAIPDAGGVYHACMLKNIGTIRIIDPDKQRCSSLETEISFNQRGQQGLPGTDGASPTVAQLAAGDSHCPAGGASITDAAGSTAYVCSGQDGADGRPFAGTFTSPNGQYSIAVADGGIQITSANGTGIVLTGSSLDVRSHGTMSLSADTDLLLRGGSNVDVRASGNATFQAGGNGTVRSGGTLDLTGSSVHVNGCASPAVRLGDVVPGADPTTGVPEVRAIAPGSVSVCIGG